MRRAQRGAALVIIVALVGLLAAATLARALSSPPGVEATLTTERALARAREALIAYGALGNAAGNHNNSPGALPCPDLDNDGISEQLSGSCDADVGRLPWRTLGLGPLYDGAGECLWYARSPTFSNNISTASRGGSPDAPALNPSTPGEITEILADGPSGRRVIAVVIAPGLPLPGQTRGATSGLSGCRDGDIAQFLEATEVTGTTWRHTDGSSAVVMLARDGFNDRAIVVDSAGHFATASARVLGDVQLSGGTPPFDWWSRNQWCAHLCVTPSSGRIALADGRRVERPLAAFPSCAADCAGP